MSLAERLRLAPELRDTGSWPRPEDEAIKDECRAEFGRRCAAINAYFSGTSSRKIKDVYGLARVELYRMLERCLTAKANGEILGFYALIPGFKVVAYQRKRKPKAGIALTSGGLAGAFGQLMREEESLRLYVEGATLRLRAKSPPVIANAIYEGFLVRCAKVRAPNEYPFNTNRRTRALTNYIARFLADHFANNEHIAATTMAASSFATGQPTASSQLRPYEEAEHDGHEGDFYFVIKARGLRDEWVYTTPMRLWLLLLVDRASRAILGYSYYLGSTNYPAIAVMRSIVHALKKWEPMDLTIPHLNYKPGAGFPSGVCPLGEGRLVDMVCFDNALANRAGLIGRGLTRQLGATVNVGRAELPIARPFVERLNQTLETLGFRRLPIGFNPNGPKDSREKALAAASEHAMTIDELEQVIDVMLANYNADPHSALVNRSPNEYIRMWDERNVSPIRRATDPSAVIAALTRIEIVVPIRGGGVEGRSPYVEYTYARYTNDILSKMTAWHGLRMRLVLDAEGDVRLARGYVIAGDREIDVGILRACAPWHLTPHTLEQRRLIQREARTKKIVVPPGTDMVQAFKALKLRESAERKGRTAVKQMVKAGRISTSLSPPSTSRDAKTRVPTKDWIKLKP
jgi:hypothetical protein